MKNKIELLAPAGSISSFYAAVNNGADAIYLSGKKFGARAYAENFSLEEIKDIIKKAHLVNVKIYVTVNTLIKDSEMAECITYINELYSANVDAILVQDIGLSIICRKVFPKLKLHASTQMNVHSVTGAKRLKEMGFTRIVLARECDIDLIKKIKEEVDIEVEVFGHGAMCMSYSGNCLMSSLIGGRSGNRGRCAGACRQKYKLIKDGNVLTDDYYFLSLNDLSTYKYIDKMKDANVDSIKLEGRVKRSEYVGLITSVYRNAIDKKIENTKLIDYKIKSMFNRGYTKGHIFNEENKNLSNILFSNHFGLLIGKVIKCSKNYAFIKMDPEYENDKLRLLDSIRIYSSFLEDGITLSKVDIFDKNFNKIKSLKKDEEIGKGTIFGINTHINVKEGMNVYKTSDNSLLKEYESDNKITKKVPINGLIYVKNKHLGLELKYTCDDFELRVREETKEEVLDAKSDNLSRIKMQISKINDSYFYFDKLEIKMDNAFLPISCINELRRSALLKLESEILKKRSNEIEIGKLDFTETTFDKEDGINIYVKVHSINQYDACKKLNIKNIYTENIELKGLRDILYMEDRIADNNIGISEDKKISSPYLNVLNSFSMYYYKSLGIKCVGISNELNKDEIKELIDSYIKYFKRAPSVLMMVYGYEEAMIMKHCLINKYYDLKDKNCNKCKDGIYFLRDKMNYDFPLIRANNCNLVLLNANRLHLIKYIDEIKNMGINNFLLDFTIETKDETEDILKMYIDALNGNIRKEKIDNNTSGHYLKGIE